MGGGGERWWCLLFIYLFLLWGRRGVVITSNKVSCNKIHNLLAMVIKSPVY